MSFLLLREYQQEALIEVYKAFQQGCNRQLIVLPTGAGKTIVMVAIAKYFNKKTLLLAHREELINQAVEKFQLFWPDVDIGVCMAERNEINHQIVVGSIQSCSRPKRLEQLQSVGFEVMMIDEAHHSTSDSYQNLITALEFKTSSQKLLVGLTATPQRSDKLGLADTFEQVTFSRSISTMIKGGYLSPIISRKILTNFAIEKISMNSGDFCIEDLAEAVNTLERNAFIVSKYQEYATNRKAIAFCCDVQHCYDIAKAFKGAGIDAIAVFGEMGSQERTKQLEAFKQGQIRVLTSCGILTEGYDEPSVDAIIMARPTRSSGLYTQCIGRGLRLWPGKADCLVLDFTDNHHTIDGVVSLTNAIPDLQQAGNNERQDRQEIDYTRKIEVLEECDKTFDILESARFIWVPIGNEWSLQDDDRNEIVISPYKSGYIAKLYSAGGAAAQIIESPLPLEYCSGVCEDYARRHLRVSFADMQTSWRSAHEEQTKKQSDFLKKNRAYKDGMTKGQASIEIRKIVAKKNQARRLMDNEPATTRQFDLLERYGIDVQDMTKFQALQTIGRIKKNERAAER